MKKTALAFLTASLLAGAVFAADMRSGLKPGESVPAFQVVDVNGPHKGEQLCYRCNYGVSPVVAAFIKGDAPEAAALVGGIQKLTETNKELKSFVVFMGGPELKGKIEKLATEKGVTVPLTFLPQGAKASDVAKYQINPEASTTVLLWNKGKVTANFVNVTKDQWGDVQKATASMLGK